MERVVKYIVKKIFFKYSYKTKKDRPPIILFNDWIGKNIIFDRYYEKEIVQAIIESLEFDTNKHLCIDVGPNIGNHALQFEKYFNGKYTGINQPNEF